MGQRRSVTLVKQQILLLTYFLCRIKSGQLSMQLLYYFLTDLVEFYFFKLIKKVV